MIDRGKQKDLGILVKTHGQRQWAWSSGQEVARGGGVQILGTQGRTSATGHLEDGKVTEKSSKFEKAWSILKVKGRRKTESHGTQ